MYFETAEFNDRTIALRNRASALQSVFLDLQVASNKARAGDMALMDQWSDALINDLVDTLGLAVAEYDSVVTDGLALIAQMIEYGEEMAQAALAEPAGTPDAILFEQAAREALADARITEAALANTRASIEAMASTAAKAHKELGLAMPQIKLAQDEERYGIFASLHRAIKDAMPSVPDIGSISLFPDAWGPWLTVGGLGALALGLFWIFGRPAGARK